MKESIESFRRAEHVLDLILMNDWHQSLDPKYSYYFDQLYRLLSLVRQSMEQIELLQFASEIELIELSPKPPAPSSNIL